MNFWTNKTEKTFVAPNYYREVPKYNTSYFETKETGILDWEM
jgi:hypothetical protein